ncbi:hypothetical protein RCS94_03115 [Orbaceae bacterium ac157xtp]
MNAKTALVLIGTSKVFAHNEIKLLQDRFLLPNDWMNEEIVRLNPYLPE